MNIVVLGLWHLGSVTAACTAAVHFRTVGIDDDPGRVAGLSHGEPPLYEPGLAELVRSGLDAGNLRFTTNISAVSDADVVWVCYDTPVDENDQADVKFVTRRVEAIFKHLKNDAIVLVSAQLPVGSVAALERAYAQHETGRNVAFACSPENLRLGRAIDVFQNPGRIIVGVRSRSVRTALEPLFLSFCEQLIWVSVESAEMVKHALNAFLATSVTFTNEIATICERVGADATEVETGLRSDPRIGPTAYVKPGPAFAGGTLARDINFLSGLARQHHLMTPVIDGVVPSNRAHSGWAFDHLRRVLQPLRERTVAVLGLAYKPGTSTLRRASAIDLIRALVMEGVSVRAFDPQVTSLPNDLVDSVVLATNAKSAAQGAHALVVATEWPEFRELSAGDIASVMAGTIILDPGRFLGARFAAHTNLKLISVGGIS